MITERGQAYCGRTHWATTTRAVGLRRPLNADDRRRAKPRQHVRRDGEGPACVHARARVPGVEVRPEACRMENRRLSNRDQGAGMTRGLSILTPKQTDAPSVFRPENLLREARRQRGLPASNVPAVCALDPDGDIVRTLRAEGRARRVADWACYHTDMYLTDHSGVSIGIVGCAVGAPFAVLVAEQLFVSGCQLLVSITSAGQIEPVGPTPYFVLIDRALRDEGTSHHYLPPSLFAEADPGLADRAFRDLSALPIAVHRGAS